MPFHKQLSVKCLTINTFPFQIDSSEFGRKQKLIAEKLSCNFLSDAAASITHFQLLHPTPTLLFTELICFYFLVFLFSIFQFMVSRGRLS